MSPLPSHPPSSAGEGEEVRSLRVPPDDEHVLGAVLAFTVLSTLSDYHRAPTDGCIRRLPVSADDLAASQPVSSSQCLLSAILGHFTLILLAALHSVDALPLVSDWLLKVISQ
ncbi:hypothetical protein MRX96_029183 [Rhipicephalus microplus]